MLTRRLPARTSTLERFVVAEAELRAAEPDDARAARLHHFDLRADPHAQLLQPMDFVRPADELVDRARLPAGSRGRGRRSCIARSKRLLKLSLT